MVKAESESDTGNVTSNISYLWQYLDNSRARVSQLEQELSESRHSSLTSTAGAGKIMQLEADKIELARQVSVLEDKLRVKAENKPVILVKREEGVEATIRRPPSVPRASREPNTVLAETRAKLKEERQCHEELRNKYIELEGRVKEGEAIAAKALRARFETEEALNEMRSEMEKRLKNFEAVDQERNRLVGHSVEQTDRVDALKEKLSGIKAELKAEIEEKDALKQTLQEMIDLAEALEREVQELQAAEKNRKESPEIAEALGKYKEFMYKLPGPEKPPPFHVSRLEPVCDFDTNLHGYLAQDLIGQRFLNHILYLPKRVVALSYSNFHYLAYGPTHLYDHATRTWTEGSDLAGIHGGSRELFVKHRDFVVYAGTYRCHDLRPVYSDGTNLPAHISPVEIVEAALVGCPPDVNRKQIIKQCFPDGKVKATATGLQCVGFNTQLYNSLRHKFLNDRKNTKGAQKRKTGGEDGGGKGEGRPMKIHKSG